MSIEERKIRLVQSVLGEDISEETIDKIEELLASDLLIKERLIKRVLQAEEDIKTGRYVSIESAMEQITNKLSI